MVDTSALAGGFFPAADCAADWVEPWGGVLLPAPPSTGCDRKIFTTESTSFSATRNSSCGRNGAESRRSEVNTEERVK